MDLVLRDWVGFRLVHSLMQKYYLKVLKATNPAVCQQDTWEQHPAAAAKQKNRASYHIYGNCIRQLNKRPPLLQAHESNLPGDLLYGWIAFTHILFLIQR